MGAERDNFRPNMDAIALLKADARILAPTPLTFQEEQAAFAKRKQLQVLFEATTNSKEQKIYSQELSRISSTIIASNMGVIMEMVKKQTKSSGDLPYLMSAALDGANRALETFRPELGFRFITYAEGWVVQRLRVERRFLDHHIHVPEEHRDEYRRRRQNGEDDSQIMHFLAEKTGISPEQLQGVFGRHASLEQAVFEEDDNGDSLANYTRNPSLTPDEMVEKYGLSAKMEQALQALNPELREIVILTKIECMSVENAAKHMGISLNTLRSKRDYALRILRRHYENSKIEY